MNKEGILSTTGATESLKKGKMEGGDATWQPVLTLTWFASGSRCCQICVWPIWMPPRDIKLLQEQRKSNLQHVCLESNLIPSQQAQWTIIAWELSCQVASVAPLMCGLKTLTGMGRKHDGAKNEKKAHFWTKWWEIQVLCRQSNNNTPLKLHQKDFYIDCPN